MALILPLTRTRPAAAAHVQSAVVPLPALTGLRFIAAAVVVVFHFSPLALNWSDAGPVAVTLFFLLSGFILVYTAPPHLSLRAFYVARAARIYPAYLLGFALAAGLAGVERFSPNAVCSAPQSALLPDLALVQAWFQDRVMCLNAPAWSLSCEAFFYALFPLLLPLVRRTPITCLGSVLLGVWLVGLTIPLGYIFFHPAGNAGGALYRVIHMSPAARLPDFVCGMLLGRVYLSGLRMRRPGLWAVGALGSLPLIPMCIGVFGPLTEALLWPSFAVLLLSLAQGQHASARVLGTPALCVLGEASYGLYILHFPLHLWLERLGLLAPQWNGCPSFVAYACLAVACALLNLRFVETPARHALRRMLA